MIPRKFIKMTAFTSYEEADRNGGTADTVLLQPLAIVAEPRGIAGLRKPASLLGDNVTAGALKPPRKTDPGEAVRVLARHAGRNLERGAPRRPSRAPPS